MTIQAQIQEYWDRDALITEETIRRAKGVANFFINRWHLHNKIHDDLYSAAFFALVEARDKFDGSGNFDGYAMVYVRARVIDEVRREMGRNETAKSRGHSDQAKNIKRAGELFEWDYPSQIDESYDRWIDRDFLLSLSDKPRTREIIFLVLAGYTEPEIAEKYGISPSRVSQIIHKLYSVTARDSSYSAWV